MKIQFSKFLSTVPVPSKDSYWVHGGGRAHPEEIKRTTGTSGNEFQYVLARLYRFLIRGFEFLSSLKSDKFFITCRSQETEKQKLQLSWHGLPLPTWTLAWLNLGTPSVSLSLVARGSATWLPSHPQLGPKRGVSPF